MIPLIQKAIQYGYKPLINWSEGSTHSEHDLDIELLIMQKWLSSKGIEVWVSFDSQKKRYSSCYAFQSWLKPNETFTKTRFKSYPEALIAGLNAAIETLN